MFGTLEGTRVLSKEVRWLLIALTSLLALYLVGVLVVFSVLSAVSGTPLQGMSPRACAPAEGKGLAAALTPRACPRAWQGACAAGAGRRQCQRRRPEDSLRRFLFKTPQMGIRAPLYNRLN